MGDTGLSGKMQNGGRGGGGLGRAWVVDWARGGGGREGSTTTKVTLSAKSSLILGENKAGFRRESLRLKGAGTADKSTYYYLMPASEDLH